MSTRGIVCLAHVLLWLALPLGAAGDGSGDGALVMGAPHAVAAGDDVSPFVRHRPGADMGWHEQTVRFLSFRDGAVRAAVVGGILMGISCGLLGSFMVMRRLSLMGDMLSHAVLPGVVLGFMWGMTKDPLALFIGAIIAGLLSVAALQAVTATTRIKEDAGLGMILAGFYGVGICLLTILQGHQSGSKAGLGSILFGQAAALQPADVIMMGVLTVLALALVVLFYKELLVDSFDPGFSRVAGLPVRFLRGMFLFLLTVAVVVALQAAGVVLVSALLIIPAAAAYLLVRRMSSLLIVAAIVGVFSSVGGAYLSFLRPNLPTGPFIILTAGGVFCLAFFLGPRSGLVWRWFRHGRSRRRIRLENTLKAVYHEVEERGFDDVEISCQQLASRLRCGPVDCRRRMRLLERSKWLERAVGGSRLHRADNVPYYRLTAEGWRRALAVIRNHRLWETYLQTAADYDNSHVHDDAERMEHVLPVDIVRRLEERLEFPGFDPHGQIIPSQREIDRGEAPERGEGGR